MPILLVSPVMQSTWGDPVLPCELLESLTASAIGPDRRSHLLVGLNGVVITCAFHPPILTARSPLNRMHSP